jgi:hypothetical protein
LRGQKKSGPVKAVTISPQRHRDSELSQLTLTVARPSGHLLQCAHHGARVVPRLLTGRDTQLDRHAIVRISVPANKNALRTKTASENSIRDFPALVDTRNSSGIRKACDKLLVGFCLQAVNDEQNHARDLLGALLYRCLASPTKHLSDNIMTAFDNFIE